MCTFQPGILQAGSVNGLSTLAEQYIIHQYIIHQAKSPRTILERRIMKMIKIRYGTVEWDTASFH